MEITTATSQQTVRLDNQVNFGLSAEDEGWMRIMRAVDLRSIFQLNQVSKSLHQLVNKYFLITTGSETEAKSLLVWLKSLGPFQKANALSMNFSELKELVQANGLTFSTCCSSDVSSIPSKPAYPILPAEMWMNILKHSEMRPFFRLAEVCHDFKDMRNELIGQEIKKADSLKMSPETALKYFQLWLMSSALDPKKRELLLSSTISELTSCGILELKEGCVEDTLPFFLYDVELNFDRLSDTPKEEVAGILEEIAISEKPRVQKNREAYLQDLERALNPLPNFVEATFLPNEMCRTDKKELKQSLTTLIKRVVWDSCFLDAAILLKRIILNLNDRSIPLVKRQEALIALANAGQNCSGIIYQECVRQVNKLSTSIAMMTLEELLLRWLQTLKEDILIESLGHGHFRVIDHVRASSIGRAWGLEAVNPHELEAANLNEIDHFAMILICREIHKCAKTLQVNYIPLRIVQAIKERIILEQAQPMIMEYMGMNLPDDIDPQSLFSTDDNNINEKGVLWLLESHGFLKRSKKASQE